jgi:hypothetical protein
MKWAGCHLQAFPDLQCQSAGRNRGADMVLGGLREKRNDRW